MPNDPILHIPFTLAQREPKKISVDILPQTQHVSCLTFELCNSSFWNRLRLVFPLHASQLPLMLVFLLELVKVMVWPVAIRLSMCQTWSYTMENLYCQISQTIHLTLHYTHLPAGSVMVIWIILVIYTGWLWDICNGLPFRQSKIRTSLPRLCTAESPSSLLMKRNLTRFACTNAIHTKTRRNTLVVVVVWVLFFPGFYEFYFFLIATVLALMLVAIWPSGLLICFTGLFVYLGWFNGSQVNRTHVHDHYYGLVYLVNVYVVWSFFFFFLLLS